MTAQELKRIDDMEKAKKRNSQKYHTEAIKEYSGKIVASSSDNYYTLVVYSDKSASLIYNGKYGRGHYCGTDNLKNHFKNLMKYSKPQNDSIIPAGWKVIEKGFFEALGII